MLRKARLEHEGQRVVELLRLQLDRARLSRSPVGVGPMRQHHVVQAHAARHEAFRLGVIAGRK